MDLEQLLFTTLKSIDGGIFEMFAPQNRGHPYSTYQVVSDEKTNALAGQCDYEQIRFQINTYGDTTKQVREISKDIQSKLRASSEFSCLIYQSFRDMTEEGITPREVIDFKLILK